jgi:uncharacterized protein
MCRSVGEPNPGLTNAKKSARLSTTNYLREGALVMAARVVALLAVVALLSGAAPPPRDRLDNGVWAGLLRLCGAVKYVTVAFPDAAAADDPQGDLYFPRRSEVGSPLARLSHDGRNIAFQARYDAVTYRFTGVIEEDAMRGSLRAGPHVGTFELHHLIRLDATQLEPFVGTYRAPDRDVMVARPYTYDMFLDTKTGRMGFLWPSGRDTFVSGPSKGIHFPFVATFRFTRDTTGAVRAVDVAFAKDAAIHATRVPSFRSRPLDFTNGEATLRGTFFLPDGNAPFPAVMLLAGSNYQTRSAQNAFLSWVGDVFLKHGFAVYAYDKRGADFSTGERSDGFVVADAVKGFEAMARQPEVRASCMGIWGISQGGMAAPKVAATTPGVAFIANTSGAVVNGNLQEIQRTALEMRADGFSESEIADAVRLQTLKFNYAITGKGWDEYIVAYHSYEHRAWFPDPYVGPPSDPKSPAFAFWAQEGNKSPADYWKQFHGQALYIDGEFETNQERATNFGAFVDAMKTAGNTTYETDVVAGADHSMLIDPRGGNTIDRLLTSFAMGYFSSLGRWVDTIACARRRGL